jgi:hypothetical protein
VLIYITQFVHIVFNGHIWNIFFRPSPLLFLTLRPLSLILRFLGSCRLELPVFIGEFRLEIIQFTAHFIVKIIHWPTLQ